jgi:hypothetical protein
MRATLPECRLVPWVETHSLSFSARHESAQAAEAEAVLDALERFRDGLAGLFERLPHEISVVMHPRPLALAFAHPWLPLARRVAAPASRRYFAGWFGEREIHVLAPPALERRASRVPGSRDALLRTPHHEYAHIVLGANSPGLPPPFTVGSFRTYVRWAWLCEGAAAHLSGQTRRLGAAIARRLREGGRPEFPPSARDAHLLGGTIFAMLDEEAGPRAVAFLATSPLDRGPRTLLHEAFERPAAAVERDWRDYLASVAAAG